MAINSSLIKTILHNSIAEGIYKEISSRSSRYYYFIGKTLSWVDELNPPVPIDSVEYENSVRNEIILMKEIKPTDVAFVVPRCDWVSGNVYDQYDDEYSTELTGINLYEGGENYVSTPTVYIGSSGAVNWSANTPYNEGVLIRSNGLYYITLNSGTSGQTAPTSKITATDGTLSLKEVVVFDGGGSGAAASARVLNGKVIEVVMTNKGIGYTTAPSVVIAGGSGNGTALANSVIVKGPKSNSQKIENAQFFVLTNENNVYLCLDNNNNSVSTVKPFGTDERPLVTSDGYVWKFLYNIPGGVRTKFLTRAYMPVLTALQNQFYSNGEIQQVSVKSQGKDYLSAVINVQGDGYLQSDPVYVEKVNLVSGGTNYSNPIVSVDDPISGVVTWSAGAQTIIGQLLKYNNNIYKVVIPGNSGSEPPTHKYGVANNGNSALEYIATTAKLNVSVFDGAISSVTMSQMIRRVYIVNVGSGYIDEPTITFSGGNGSNAVAVSVLQNGALSKVVVTDPGENYTSIPEVIVGTPWSASAVLTPNTQVFVANRLYTVTTGGTTGNTAPVHTVGTQTNGTAGLTYAGTAAKAKCELKCGAGYSETPNVTIIDSSGSGASIKLESAKSEAILTPIIEDGQIVYVQIDDGGVGYTYADLTVSGTTGSGAVLEPNLSIGNINSIQSNVELTAVDGRICNIPVVSQGYGYSIGTTVTIVGDGTGATAEAVVENGKVVKINITNYGRGYRNATVTINGVGFGAKARAVIGPYGGFGKEAINNLYSRTLMFYSNVAEERNQGFIVDNDYRQFGIIKSPRRYSSTQRVVTGVASACWVLSAPTVVEKYPKDSVIVKRDDNTRYRVVMNSGTSLLVQSLDNSVPISGDVFTNANRESFSVSEVSSPTCDKYSGDLLFIDNKQGFTTTQDQSVTFRTIIQF